MKPFSLLLSAFILASTTLLAEAKEPTRGEGLIYAEAGNVAVSFIDTDTQKAPFEKGCRFMQGGWIRNMSVKKDSWRWTPLMESSVFTYHPAFGVPEELTPSIKIADIDGKDSIHLKIGVGKVLRHGDNVFKDTLVEAFPWQQATSHDEQGNIKLSFTQAYNAEQYGYKLSKDITLKGDGKIQMDCALTNKGTNVLVLESYLHPFMRFENSPDSYWYAFLDQEPTGIVAPEGRIQIPINPKNSTIDIAPPSPGAGKWLLVGRGNEPDRLIAMNCGDSLEKIRFWMKDDCFSVEPFIALSIPPGETHAWTWSLLLR